MPELNRFERFMARVTEPLLSAPEEKREKRRAAVKGVKIAAAVTVTAVLLVLLYAAVRLLCLLKLGFWLSGFLLLFTLLLFGLAAYCVYDSLRGSRSVFCSFHYDGDSDGSDGADGGASCDSSCGGE